MIGICTDSNAHLSAALAQRFGIEIVPLTVTVDDIDYLDGIDLDADAFYAKYLDGACPKVSTSQPSPGQFAVAYEDLAARGCTEILSIHASSAASGTISAARLAAHSVPTPVRLVNSGPASFGLGCCVWAAASAVAQGASVDCAALIAEELVSTIGNVFVVGALDTFVTGASLPVLSACDDRVAVIERAATALDAINAMAAYTLRWGERLHVAIGHSDAATAPMADALEEALAEAAGVRDVVRYRIGPSIGVHTGLGTIGCLMFRG
ncbi:MAG TPA: DegV family protein [Ilumatobacteraceae bacterium]|nr:DegV family protein [Ilumatobacteraceae bacterium]HRB04771.1 DegV family protein [Ilumatobacteraceae bacterium]